jgi:hypothetical protein
LAAIRPELYDEKADPRENRNLAGDQRIAAVAERVYCTAARSLPPDLTR